MTWRPFVCWHPAWGMRSGVLPFATASNRAIALTLFGYTLSCGFVRTHRGSTL